MKKYCLLLSLLFLIGACATPYQKQTWYAFRGGYSDIKLEENKFMVSFNGNGMTDAITVSNFALFRSAEVTLENGFNFFIIDKKDDAQFHNPVYGNGVVGVIISESIPIPSSTYVISCYKQRPKSSKEIHDAKSVIEDLKFFR